MGSSPFRYFIRFQYHGATFHGWQKQPNACTVQETMESALSHLLGKETEVIGAGRTDTGVHASEMWAHFDAENKLDEAQLTYRLNAFLPKSIAIFAIVRVKEDAHTRFSAVSRTYAYHIHFRKNAFLNDRSWHLRRPLDREALDEAAEVMKEFEEFSAFARSNDAASHHRCHIFDSMWEHRDDASVYTVKANRFLRNMVRAMVGTMIDVGMAKINSENLRSIIRSGDRRRAGESAPPQGLFLTHVEYPEDIFQWQK